MKKLYAEKTVANNQEVSEKTGLLDFTGCFNYFTSALIIILPNIIGTEIFGKYIKNLFGIFNKLSSEINELRSPIQFTVLLMFIFVNPEFISKLFIDSLSNICGC